MKSSEIRSILATDCGSTTTKCILIEKRGEEYRLIVRGEAPSTVEKPFDDVTIGVINSIQEVEELSGRKILDENNRIITPQRDEKTGVDIYVSTSSAGGGLQMLVAGVVRTMTAESAERAALGAGAIVMDVIASNDRYLPHEQIERIRYLRPDMILLSGGVDGGTVSHVVELAELIAAANPRPRLGKTYNLPIVYAGNKDARDAIAKTLEGKAALFIVDNIRPTLEVENLLPARERIHELFMEHVMAQAPGYDKLKQWTDAPIMPTPGAVGKIIETIARLQGINVIGVDIGGATTDVFSVFRGIFNRTVSANLGMSYSISNVLSSAGIENIMRWVPFDLEEGEVRNRIKNKMIRPTTIPQLLEELIVEHAIAREALRLAFEQHKQFATELKGVQQHRTIAEAFTQTASGKSLVDMMALDLLVGSGGVLSHAPQRNQAAMMLIDGFEPCGATHLAVDSIFMMPQLGVLSEVHPEAAMQVFERDCLIHLGSVLAVEGNTNKSNQVAMEVELEFSNGERKELTLKYRDIVKIPLPIGEQVVFKARPTKWFNLGAGKGKEVQGTLKGGVVGIILDARGRPLQIPTDKQERIQTLTHWFNAMDLYPAFSFSRSVAN